MSLAALACTGDPLLDQLLAECTSFTLRSLHCERAVDALPEVEARRPALVFVSPALGDVRPLLKIEGVRVCWLAEGAGPEPPEGVEVLRAERLSAQLVDAWVRRPRQGSAGSGIPSPPPLPRRQPGAGMPTPPPVRQMRSDAGDPAPQPFPPKQPDPDTPVPPPARQNVPHAGPLVPAPARPKLPDHGGPAPSPVRQKSSGATLPPPAWRDSPAPRQLPAAQRPPQHSAHRVQPPAPRPVIRVLRQQVVAFWGGKPGGGRSTLAVALADLLARSGELRVCTVDLNPYNSSLAALLGREQEVSSWVQIGEAFSRGHPLPGDGLRWVTPNWALVSGPDGRPDLVTRLSPEAIAWLVDGLRSHFDYIILDPEARPGPVREAAARLAHLVLVTVTCDYPDVLDTARGFEAAVEQGLLDRSRCRLVLNRWLDGPYLAPGEVADCFGMPVSAILPLSPEAVLHAAGQGHPVTRSAAKNAEPLRQAIAQLLGVVAPAVASAGQAEVRAGAGSPWRGWLTR